MRSKDEFQKRTDKRVSRVDAYFVARMFILSMN